MEKPIQKSRTKTFNNISSPFFQIGKEIMNSPMTPKLSNLSIKHRSYTPELLLSPKSNHSYLFSSFKKNKTSKFIQVNTYNNNITIIHQNIKSENDTKITQGKASLQGKSQLKKSILKLSGFKQKPKESVDFELIEPPQTPLKNVKFNPTQLISEYEYNDETRAENNCIPNSYRSFKSEQPFMNHYTNALTQSPLSAIEITKIDETKAKIDLLDKCHYEKKLGVFSGFCAFTFKNSQKKNFDKLSIFINKQLSSVQAKNEKISLNFFGLHHGAGGDTVSSMLKDNLHKHIFENPSLYKDPISTLFSSFQKIETQAKKNISKCNKCGSCSLALLSLNEKLYIANIGNSKGIISLNNSFDIFSINKNHNPSNEIEMKRLQQNNIVFQKDIKSKGRKYIILPSHIHSSRILGFNEAKLNKGILHLPEIYEIDINSVSNGCSKIDFLILLNDTISFYLNNRDVALALYRAIKESLENNLSYGKMMDNIVGEIAKEAVERGAKGNLSVILVDKGSLYKVHKERNLSKVEEIIEQLKSSLMDFEDIFPYSKIFDEDWLSCSNVVNENINKKNSLNFCIERNREELSKMDNRPTAHTITYNNSSVIDKEKHYKMVNDDFHTSFDEIENTQDKKPKKKKKSFSLCGCFL